MASRLKEDEKNEKIIRGLLKLPPNRRCINCNSLGPQYVCTNFWTFVCTNCSGIHREFTHRVKSVSMAKFASQEVAALQQGGNQRAREIYFKDFEQQVHQLPDSSNVDKLRAFIKHVYVERRYAGDRPPRAKSGEREDVPEGKNYRADSRSPPYEDSYGDRRFGDRASRKYEYDRSRYDERGYGYDERRSPGQYEYDKGRYDRGYQDNRRYDDAYKRSPTFESDGSQNRRFEDRRFPETPDRRRSGEPSPNYQKDYDTNSPPPVRPVREILGDDVPTLRVGDFPRGNGNRDTDTSSVRSLPETRRELRNQRTTSSSSMGSADGNSPTMQRAHSASLIDFTAEPDPSPAVQKDTAGVGPSASSSSGVQDPFVTSLTKQPSAASQQDLFAASLVKEPSKVGSQDLFAASLPGQQASSTNTPGNGGWATFDFAPQSKVSVTAPVQPPAVTTVSNPGTWLAQSSVPQASSSVPSTNNSWSAFSQPASTNGMTGLQSWSDILSSAASGPQGASHATQPSVSAPHVAQPNAYASPTPQPNAYAPQTAQPNAYAPQTAQPNAYATQTAQSNVSAAKPPLPSSDVQKTHHSTGIAQNGRKEIPADLFKPLYPELRQNMGIPFSSQYGTVPGAFYPSSAMPLQGSVQYPRPPSKSTNPFDTAGDLPTSHATSFPSVGSLHAALPNYSAPGTPWMTSSTPTSFQPTVAPGSYMNQVPNSMPFNMQSASTSANIRPSASFAGNDFFNTLGTSNFSSQSSFPSVGGNPFG